MKINAKLNGIPVELEIPDGDLAALATPEQLNQKRAAAFCKVSVPTFRSWKVPKNKNRKYSVEVLRKRMSGE